MKIITVANNNKDNKSAQLNLEHIFMPIFNTAFATNIQNRPNLLELTVQLKTVFHLVMAGEFNDNLAKRPESAKQTLNENIATYLRDRMDDYFAALFSGSPEAIEHETNLLKVEIESIKRLES